MRAIIQNTFGVVSAEIEIDRITLLAGPNRASKSSACNALACAASGDATAGGTKKDAQQIVRDGAQQGLVLIGDDQNWIRWALPAAEISTGGTPPQISRIASGLDEHWPFSLRADERSAELIRILKATPKRGQIFAEMRDMGIAEDQHARALRDEGNTEAAIVEDLSAEGEPWQPDQFARIIAEISKNGPGWDESAKRHEVRATEFKGAWRKLTGKTWGSAAAPAWRPDGWLPRLDMLKIGEAEDALKAAEAAHLAAVAKVGSPDTERAEKERLAALYPARHDLHEAAIKAAGEAEATVLRTKNVRDATPVPADQAGTVDCPCCHKPLRYTAGLLGQTATLTLASDTLKPEEIKAQRLAKATAEGDYSKAQIEQGAANRDLAQKKLYLQQAADAKEWLQQQQHPPGGAADTAAQQIVESKALALTLAKADLSRVKLNAEALATHQAVEREIALAKWMGPGGCRATLLKQVVGSFNTGVLGPLCETAGWLPVEVIDTGAGFEFGYGGRYRFLSESEKWRINVALRFAVARIEKSPFVIVDRLDVLTEKTKDGLGGFLRLAKIMVQNDPPIHVLVGMKTSPDYDFAPMIRGGVRVYTVAAGVVTPMGAQS